MSLADKINKELKKAMIIKDDLKISTLRMLKAGIQNLEIELRAKRKELNDESILEVVSREVKRRKEAIDAFVKGLRQDLADKERKELEILLSYLPAQLSDDELREVAQKKIKEIGATGPTDFGKVMGPVAKETKGKADGNRLSQIVKEELGKIS
ncbi:MAG: GatB/YqeY domain-containing protein [Candidatus Parcubacteria bacterium]|nr:GatB/YqeY domain-containing protein [Candidatus Parcubacteria bacterium]